MNHEQTSGAYGDAAQVQSQVQLGRVANASATLQIAISRFAQEFGALESILSKLLGHEPMPPQSPKAEAGRPERIHVSELQQLDETIETLGSQTEWIERLVRRAHSL